MTAPVLFDYSGQQVRTVVVDGEPRFVLTDVCRVLDLSNPSMVAQTIDSDDLSTAEVIDSMGRSQTALVLTEAGLYEVIFQSRKPEAKGFRRWVTNEVLPTIRKTGRYIAAMPSRLELAQMVIEAETLLEASQERVAELEPKAQVADKFLDAEGDLAVADAAKALTRAGIKVGEGRLFKDLAHRGWTYRATGDGRWRVYQSAIEAGWMSVLPQSHYHPKTGVLVLDPPQPRVTPKGLQRLLTDPAT